MQFPGSRSRPTLSGTDFYVFFARQALTNPIKRQETGKWRDKGAATPVQNILKKVKKSLVRPRNLH
jgi:hypothetical protein